MKHLLLALTACALSSGCLVVNSGERSVTPAAAIAPVEVPAARNPLDLRRTTLIVRDIEASLALYRDVLGMTVEYDQELTSPRLGRAGSDGTNRSRLVLLKANDGFIGMLGLWQFLDQTGADRRPPMAADFTPGTIVLLFNTADVANAYRAAAASRGVREVSPPTERRYPSPAGDIVVIVSMLVDPDGHTIELNQLISDPRRPAQGSR
jgi:catechol 2,3-dioxygenase-like lactoylglutathione lyase family enzyme